MRVGQLLGQLVPGRLTKQGLLRLIGGPMLGHHRRASFANSPRSCSSVRLAFIDAFAPIFIPSRVIVPSLTMPDAAHSTSTSVNSRCTSSGLISANRQIVLWSGTSWAQITRHATSTQHNCSMRRDDRIPCDRRKSTT